MNRRYLFVFAAALFSISSHAWNKCDKQPNGCNASSTEVAAEIQTLSSASTPEQLEAPLKKLKESFENGAKVTDVSKYQGSLTHLEACRNSLNNGLSEAIAQDGSGNAYGKDSTAGTGSANGEISDKAGMQYGAGAGLMGTGCGDNMGQSGDQYGKCQNTGNSVKAEANRAKGIVEGCVNNTLPQVTQRLEAVEKVLRKKSEDFKKANKTNEAQKFADAADKTKEYAGKIPGIGTKFQGVATEIGKIGEQAGSKASDCGQSLAVARETEKACRMAQKSLNQNAGQPEQKEQPKEQAKNGGGEGKGGEKGKGEEKPGGEKASTPEEMKNPMTAKSNPCDPTSSSTGGISDAANAAATGAAFAGNASASSSGGSGTNCDLNASKTPTTTEPKPDAAKKTEMKVGDYKQVNGQLVDANGNVVTDPNVLEAFAAAKGTQDALTAANDGQKPLSSASGGDASLESGSDTVGADRKRSRGLTTGSDYASSMIDVPMGGPLSSGANATGIVGAAVAAELQHGTALVEGACVSKQVPVPGKGIMAKQCIPCGDPNLPKHDMNICKAHKERNAKIKNSVPPRRRASFSSEP